MRPGTGRRRWYCEVVVSEHHGNPAEYEVRYNKCDEGKSHDYAKDNEGDATKVRATTVRNMLMELRRHPR